MIVELQMPNDQMRMHVRQSSRPSLTQLLASPQCRAKMYKYTCGWSRAGRQAGFLFQRQRRPSRSRTCSLTAAQRRLWNAR